MASSEIGTPAMFHTDTTSGDLLIHRGHSDVADLTVSLGYDTARSLMIDQDPQLAIEALIFGRHHGARRTPRDRVAIYPGVLDIQHRPRL